MQNHNAALGDTGTLGKLPDSIVINIIERLKVHQRVPLRNSCRRLRQLVNASVTKIKLDPTHSEDALRWELSDRFPKLEHIEIMKPSEVDCFTDQTFAQLALKDLSRLTGLTSLNLEHCTQLSVAGLAALALACPRISKLQIPQLCMSDSMLLVLARLPDLSRLRVQCCRHCNEVALAYLSDLRRLTALELEDYGQALRQAHDVADQPDQPAVLSNIFAGKAALLDWVTGMTSLTHIDIQRVDISFPELQRFTALPALQHLGNPARPLSCVTKLVSHNILYEASLRTTFPSLGALSCDSSDAGLRAIAELTGLVNLFLWTSPTDAITDCGLTALSRLRRLETFRLEGAAAVTDMGWLQFARGHSALTRVDLVKVPGVTGKGDGGRGGCWCDIGFILSLRQLPGLQRASFMECPGIDTPTLAALLAFCPALEYIELQDCPAISLAALRKMLAATAPSRPDLDIVFRK
eukprot:XP_001700983.1 predicted protein [Chlamydomonas reinhardtii]